VEEIGAVHALVSEYFTSPHVANIWDIILLNKEIRIMAPNGITNASEFFTICVGATARGAVSTRHASIQFIV